MRKKRRTGAGGDRNRFVNGRNNNRCKIIVRRAVAILLSLLSTIWVVFTLTGCRGNREKPTDLLSRALDAEMTVNTGDMTYRVTVHIGAATDGVRTSEVIFLAPASLSGMTVRENSEGRVVTYGEKEIRTEHGDGLFLAPSLLLPADTVDTDTLTENGMIYAVFLLSDGRRIYTDAESGVIKRIECGECVATVEWIEERQNSLQME